MFLSFIFKTTHLQKRHKYGFIWAICCNLKWHLSTRFKICTFSKCFIKAKNLFKGPYHHGLHVYKSYTISRKSWVPNTQGEHSGCKEWWLQFCDARRPAGAAVAQSGPDVPGKSICSCLSDPWLHRPGLGTMVLAGSALCWLLTSKTSIFHFPSFKLFFQLVEELIVDYNCQTLSKCSFVPLTEEMTRYRFSRGLRIIDNISWCHQLSGKNFIWRH